MKHLIFAFSLLIVTSTKAQGVDFIAKDTPFKEVLAQAKAQNKLVFVDCYTVWCGPCKILDKEVFPLKKVGDFFNENFVCIKVDMEKGEGIDMAKNFEIKGFPTLLFLNSEGNEVHRRMGGGNADMIIDQANIAVNPARQLTALEKRYESGDRQLDFMADYIYTLQSTDEKKMKEIGRAYIKTMNTEDFTTKDGLVILRSAGIDYDSKAYKAILKNRDEIINSGKIEAFWVDNMILVAVSNYIEENASAKSFTQFEKEIEKIKNNPQLSNSTQLSDMLKSKEVDWYAGYYLTNKEFDKWFDTKLKAAKANGGQQELWGKMMLAYQVGFNNAFEGQTKMYDRCIKMTNDIIAQPSAKQMGLTGNYELAYLYYRKGNKDQTLKYWNGHVEDAKKMKRSPDMNLKALIDKMAQ